MLKTGVIQPSSSPYSSPIWVVPKKTDASGKKKIRVVIDYRKLNEKTIDDKFPIPQIEDILDSLGKSQYFTTLDLKSGFHQIEMDPKHSAKTAFSTDKGHFEFTRMPFGLKNAPATFQRAMNNILQEFIGKFCYVYLDDIIITGNNLKHHLQNISIILKRLSEFNLKIQLDKCEFLKKETEFLGHVITAEGIKPDPTKIEKIKNWKLPTNQKEIKQFLGLIGYYRRFIKDFSKLAKPLTQYLKKEETVNVKDTNYTQAFEKLKNILTSDQILSYPNFNLPFILTTDASNYALGAVLSQVQDKIERPIAFASRSLNKTENNYSTTEKEALAIIWAVNKYYPYLYGQKFTLITDHKPLTFIKTSTRNSKILRWRLELENFDYDIQYKEGKANVVADALSRKDETNTISCLSETKNKAPLEERKNHLTMDMNANETNSISDSQHNNPPTSEKRSKEIKDRLNQLAPSRNRHKRWDMLGSAWKWLAGTPDAEDLRIINKTLNDLISENNAQININNVINNKIAEMTVTINLLIEKHSTKEKLLLQEIDAITLLVYMDATNRILEDIEDAILRTRIQLTNSKLLSINEILAIETIINNQGIQTQFPEEALKYAIPKIAIKEKMLFYILEIPKVENNCKIFQIVPLTLNDSTIVNIPQYIIMSKQGIFLTNKPFDLVQLGEYTKPFKDTCLMPILDGKESNCQAIEDDKTMVTLVTNNKILLNNVKNSQVKSNCGPHDRILNGNFILAFNNCTISIDNHTFTSEETTTSAREVLGAFPNLTQSGLLYKKAAKLEEQLEKEWALQNDHAGPSNQSPVVQSAEDVAMSDPYEEPMASMEEEYLNENGDDDDRISDEGSIHNEDTDGEEYLEGEFLEEASLEIDPESAKLRDSLRTWMLGHY
uniref:uncharacterized protein LOC125908330 n=1 Tax=Anopheles coluzzii TaxID=1518534 RepID=UPI0020FF7F23|nr:uncharacterized protein LOC125908330 [Anopheles coluzzii]